MDNLLKGHIDRVHRKLNRTPIPQQNLIQDAITIKNGNKNGQLAEDESSRKSSTISRTSSVSTYKGMF